MIICLAPGRYWRGRYFKAGEAEDERINGESAFRFVGVRVWLNPKERAAVESLLKQAMQLPQLQTTLVELELEYGEV
jgi:hypothetical protein